MRPSEYLALCWRDIDWDRATISVVRTLHRNEGQWIFADTKRVLCAAGVLLCIALGVSAYQVGIRRGVKTAAVMPSVSQKNQAALEQQVSDAGYEREVLHAQVEQRDKAISSLRHDLDQQSAEMSRMKLAQSKLETDLQNGQAGRTFFNRDLT
jgi:integrase